METLPETLPRVSLMKNNTNKKINIMRFTHPQHFPRIPVLGYIEYAAKPFSFIAQVLYYRSN